MDVLSECLKGVKFTRLMYRTNLSYSTLRKYLSEALDRGLVAKSFESDGSAVYCTTKKGRDLLEKLRDINNSLSG
jgi:predicted transcriptional regulator